MFIKFNNTLIQITLSNDILLSQKTCIKDILLVKNDKALIISSKAIILAKLFSKK